jgi:hypothetical protein
MPPCGRRPFLDENRSGCPLTPDVLGRRRPLISRVLGAASGPFPVALSTRIRFACRPAAPAGNRPLLVGAQGGRGARGDTRPRPDHPAGGGVGCRQGRADLLCGDEPLLLALGGAKLLLNARQGHGEHRVVQDHDNDADDQHGQHRPTSVRAGAGPARRTRPPPPSRWLHGRHGAALPSGRSQAGFRPRQAPYIGTLKVPAGQPSRFRQDRPA